MSHDIRLVGYLNFNYPDRDPYIWYTNNRFQDLKGRDNITRLKKHVEILDKSERSIDMSIYKELLEKANKRGKFKIDLNNKNLWLGRLQYISEGDVLDENELIGKDDLKDFNIELDLSSDCWSVVSYLFDKFKHSVPNSHWKDRSYFKALDVDDLTDNELAFNCDRKLAQAMIEGYILCASLQGWLKWDNESHWFWQDENNPECIVLKQWVK